MQAINRWGYLIGLYLRWLPETAFALFFTFQYTNFYENFFLLLMPIGLVFSSCSKDNNEDKTSSTSESSASTAALDRDYTLLVIGGSGGGGTQTLTCGWSDGYGTGQVACAGDHLSLIHI